MSKPITSNQQVDPAGKRSAATTKVFVLGNTNYYYHLPAERVHQLPHRVQTMEKLVLCPSYDPASPTGSCKMGARCRLVHGDTRNLEPSTVHVNYAWRTLDDVTIPRYPAGETLHVAAPNSRNATDVMDSGCVLATQALQSKRRPLTHCAHYYFNRQCNLGAECRFIHAVFIDSTAASLRRAPAPVQLGRRLRFPDAAKHILGSDTDFQDQSSVCDPELEYDDDAMASHGWAQSAVSQQAQPPTNFAYPTPGMLSILSPFAVLPYLLPSPTRPSDRHCSGRPLPHSTSTFAVRSGFSNSHHRLPDPTFGSSPPPTAISAGINNMSTRQHVYVQPATRHGIPLEAHDDRFLGASVDHDRRRAPHYHAHRFARG
jgi:hypothetical protein